MAAAGLALACNPPPPQQRLMIFLWTKLRRAPMKRRRLCFAGEVEASQCPAAPPPSPLAARFPLRLLKLPILPMTVLTYRVLTMMREVREKAALGLPVCSERIRPTPAGSSAR